MATKKAAAPKADTSSKTAATKTVKATAPAVTAEAAIQTEVPAKAATKKVTGTTKVTFELPKEAVMTATSVKLVGEFNNWDINNSTELKKQKDGSFKTTVELVSGKEYQYRFLINGETWENAWNAPKYVQTSFGTFNSVVFA
jgi:1,4-alpha-glucan branching enzyme